MDLELTGSQLHQQLYSDGNQSLEVAPPTHLQHILLGGHQGDQGTVEYTTMPKVDSFNDTKVIVSVADPLTDTAGKLDDSDLATREITGVAGADSLQCGLCFLLFHDLKEFLRHKATHVGRGAGLGCELCGLSYSRQRPLFEHYRIRHSVRLQPSKKERTVANNRIPCEDVETSRRPATTKSGEILAPLGTISTTGLVTGTIVSQTGTVTAENKPNFINKFTPITNNSFLDTPNVSIRVNTDASNDQQNSLGTNCTSIVDGRPDVLVNDEHCGNTIVAGMSGDHLENDPSKLSCAPVPDNNTLVFQITPSNVIQNKMPSISVVNEEPISDHPPEGSSVNDLKMPDFHFVSRITHKTGTSISYGKHYFKCLYCESQTYWRNAMCRHMQEKHRDILSLQPYLDVAPGALSDGQVVLKMTEYISQQKGRARRRVRGREKQDLPGEFQCQLCDKVFHRQRYLRVHMKTHQSGGEQHLCPVCGKPFKLKLYLTQHMRTHMDRGSFKCGECDFTSDVNHLIHAHRQIHTRGSVLCDVCGLAYSDKSTLVKHRRVHDNTRPYCCKFPGCTWRFNTEALCQGHFKAHTMQGKFVCNMCGYAFRKKHHLTRHEKKQHNTSSDNRSRLSCDDLTVPAVEVQENQSVDTGSICELNIHEGNIVNIHDDGITSDSIVNNNRIVDGNTIVEDHQLELENALQSGQLVIATEVGYGEESGMNYEMSDLHSSYRMLMQQQVEMENSDKGILIPQTDGSHIYFQHEATETVASETHCIHSPL